MQTKSSQLPALNRMDELPAFPEGRYFVATRDSLLRKQLIDKTWLGEDIVAWRDEEGRRRRMRMLSASSCAVPRPLRGVARFRHRHRHVNSADGRARTLRHPSASGSRAGLSEIRASVAICRDNPCGCPPLTLFLLRLRLAPSTMIVIFVRGASTVNGFAGPRF